MDNSPTIFDWASLLLGLLLMVASFISKTIVWGRMVGGKPQKITWFGRIWMFLIGSVFVYQSALAIVKWLHVAINPSWFDIGLPLSEVVLFVLGLSLIVPVLIVSLKDLWLRRKEKTGIERIISICLLLIFLYLIWETTPGIVRKVLTLFHDLGRGRAG